MKIFFLNFATNEQPYSTALFERTLFIQHFGFRTFFVASYKIDFFILTKLNNLLRYLAYCLSVCQMFIDALHVFFFYKQLHFWVQPGVAKAFLQFQPQSCLMVASSVQISALVAYELLVVFNVEDGWVFNIFEGLDD